MYTFTPPEARPARLTARVRSALSRECRRGRRGEANLTPITFGTYDVRVTVHRKKIRLNVTIDPDIYREAKVYIEGMDRTWSGFFEECLVGLITHLKPIQPLLGRSDVQQHEAKLAMIRLMTDFQQMSSEEIGKMMVIMQEIAEKEAGTDRKAQE